MRCLTIVVAVIGCGGGSGSDTPSRADVCADLCARADECGNDDPLCADECTTDELFRDDFYQLYLECTEASCANIGEGCFVMVLDDLTVLSAETAYAADCEARELECGAPFSRDFCHAQDVRVFSAGYIETELQGCLDLACTEIDACLEAAIFDSF